MEDVYKNIKKRRLELGMTQSELARRAGADLQVLCKKDPNLPLIRYEKGRWVAVLFLSDSRCV